MLYNAIFVTALMCLEIGMRLQDVLGYTCLHFSGLHLRLHDITIFKECPHLVEDLYQCIRDILLFIVLSPSLLLTLTDQCICIIKDHMNLHHTPTYLKVSAVIEYLGPSLFFNDYCILYI